MVDKRLHLQYILATSAFDRLPLYGVELVSGVDRTLDCVAHAFGLGYKPSQKEAHRLAKGLEPKETPDVGDLIVYYHRTVGDFPIHCGIVLEDGRIESKWGNGPIVRHMVEDLPISCQFGRYVYYKNPRK